MFVWVLMGCFSASAQCITGDSIWKKIDRLAGSGLPTDIQLQQLQELQNISVRCKSGSDTTDAYILQRFGVMYYKKSDFQSAIKFTLNSLRLLDSLSKSVLVNPKQKLRCYRNLNIYYESLGWTAKRNEANDSSISISMASGITDSVLLYSICDKVIDLLNKGDYSRCLQYALLSQNLADKYGYSNSVILKRIISWKINVLLLLKDYAGVRKELNGRLETYAHSGYDDYMGNLYGLWAGYYIGTGKIDSALLRNQEGIKYCMKSGFNAGSASLLNNNGFIYCQYKGDYSKALKDYLRALKFADAKESLSIYDNIGNVYTKRNMFDSAFYYYQKAFDQIRPGIDESGLLDKRVREPLNNLAEYIVSLVLDKADAYLNSYKYSGSKILLKNTLNAFRTADRILEQIKEDQFETQSRLFWRSNSRRLYEHAIEACWLSQNSEQGFYFCEKSRAVLLDDQLKEMRVMQEREALERYQLKNDLRRLENELDSINPGSVQYTKLQMSIIRKREEQDYLLERIRERDPLYFARNAGAGSASVSDLRNTVLKDHSALLEIFDGDSSLFVLLITNTGCRLSKISKKNYDSLSQEFISLISRPEVLNRQYGKFVEISGVLYTLIFSNQLIKKGSVIVSPDGLYFPFDALVTRLEGGIHYMVEDYNISYTYSARFLMSKFPDDADKSKLDFMGIAPVKYADYLKLAPLSGSDMSLHKIQSYFNEPLIKVHESSSKRTFLSNFSDYRIIQIYSHASYNDSVGKPLVYFADSSLELSELYSKKKPIARLVVLSACETALGKEYKGEGVFSFSREFASLGIPASVSNLWSVDNESTYRITENFYRFISKGLPTDEALRQAKLQFIKESTGVKKLPFYWASPILTGKAEIIKIKTSSPLRNILLLIGLGCIAFWLGINTYIGKKDRLGHRIM